MGKYYAKKVLIEALQKKTAELGHTPMPEDMKEPPAQAYRSFFKKWDKALKAAGIATTFATTDSKKNTTPALSPKKESVPILEAASETPLDSTVLNRRRYSKNIITQMLLDEFKRLGKKPTRKEIDANKDLPTVSTCLNYFGTTRIGDVWDEILEDL